ncbi:MAG TPA: hypothetical protein VGR73_15380 [Bryobacteraceae bacterium]|nr:hypothetical protein [Bryobacteraceae bacterium]
MALIADSGAVYALYDRRDRNHRAVREAVDLESGAILIPAAVLAEIDYLLRVRLGARQSSASWKGSRRAHSPSSPLRSKTRRSAASFWCAIGKWI